MQNELFFGTFLFLFSISCEAFLRKFNYSAERRKLTSKTIQFESSPSSQISFSVATRSVNIAVILDQPSNDAHQQNFFLRNEEILFQLCKDINKEFVTQKKSDEITDISDAASPVNVSLFVFVRAAPTVSFSQSVKYVCNLYSLLWDALSLHLYTDENNDKNRSACSVQCIITSSLLSSHFSNISENSGRSIGSNEVIISKCHQEILSFLPLSLHRVMIPNSLNDSLVPHLLNRLPIQPNSVNEHVVDTRPERLVDDLSNKVVFLSSDSLCESQPSISLDSVFDLPRYGRVAVGGSFDRLHNGHRALLTSALSVLSPSSSLIIGVAGLALTERKREAASVQSFLKRRDAVKQFILSVTGGRVRFVEKTSKDYDIEKSDERDKMGEVGEVGVEERGIVVELVELLDAGGPVLTDKSVQALVVSSETLNSAANLNKLREEKGMKRMDLLVINRSNAATLSSTFIRNREKQFKMQQ